MSLMQLPVISWNHLHAETWAWLNSDRKPKNAAVYGEGCFLYVGEAHSPLPPHNRLDLKGIFDWMHANHPDLAWVRIDEDGEVIDALPILAGE